MTTAQVVEMSVTVNNSHIHDHDHQDDHAPPSYNWRQFRFHWILSFLQQQQQQQQQQQFFWKLEI